MSDDGEYNRKLSRLLWLVIMLGLCVALGVATCSKSDLFQ